MNNTIILGSLVNDFQIENNLQAISIEDVFELFSISQITKDLSIIYPDIVESIVDGGQDGGIDSFLILIDDIPYTTKEQLEQLSINDKTQITVYINQSKYEKSFKEIALNNIYISLPLIFDLKLEQDDLMKRFNEILVERIIAFRYIWIQGVRRRSRISIKFTYSTRCNKTETNTAFDEKKKQIIDLTRGYIHNSDVNMELFSAEDLIRIYHTTVKTEMSLKFVKDPFSVAFTKEEYGYIGVASLDEYFNFVVDIDGKVREHFFESNIRHYQGKTDYNKEINDTLSSDFSRDFWWLNNGVTIIASACVPTPGELTITNPQIVNGLQTSYTIGNFYNKNPSDNRSVLIKIIITNSKENIDKIIAATNSQNPISPALLRATDGLQRTIENYFLSKEYYYDRRKNYYKNQGKPTSKIFSMQSTAQAIEAILNFNPADARSKPTSLIKEEKTYNKIFNELDNFNSYLNCCIIHKNTNTYIGTLEVNERSGLRNFAYHISRIIVSVITKKSKYSRSEIASQNFEIIDLELFQKSKLLLRKFLDEYQHINPNENIINIAKSRKFSDFISDNLLNNIQ